jgi:hypothetical protein
MTTAKRLIELRTVSDLLMELVRLGYSAQPAREPCLRADGVAVYIDSRLTPPNTWTPTSVYHREIWGIRAIHIHPELGEDTGEVFAQVKHSPDGELIETSWLLGECYAGTSERIDPHTTTVAQLGPLARAWCPS